MGSNPVSDAMKLYEPGGTDTWYVPSGSVEVTAVTVAPDWMTTDTPGIGVVPLAALPPMRQPPAEAACCASTGSITANANATPPPSTAAARASRARPVIRLLTFIMRHLDPAPG